MPLLTPIRAEGWVTRSRRRLIETAATIVEPASGEVLATAEAVYVDAPEDRKQELKERYGFRQLAPAQTANDPVGSAP